MVLKRKILFLCALLISTSICQWSFGRIPPTQTNKLARIAPTTLHASFSPSEIDSVQVTFSEKESKKEKKDSRIPSEELYMYTWCNKKLVPQSTAIRTIPDLIVVRVIDPKKKRGFFFPCNGKKSSPYGWRWERCHHGIDFAMNIGDSVFAAFDGIVRMAKNNGNYGNMIVIRHWNSLETLYAHLSAFKVKEGTSVKAGDLIGLAGNTGRSTGPHLHFETRLLYRPFNPEWILDIETQGLRNETLIIDHSFFETMSCNQKVSKSQPCLFAKVHSPLVFEKTSPLHIQKKKKISHFGKILYACSSNEYQRIHLQASTKDRRYYRAKEGDSLISISEKYQIELNDLVKANGITPGKELEKGTRIRIR